LIAPSASTLHGEPLRTPRDAWQDVPSLDIPLHLDHLNPVFRQLQVPPEDVIVREPQQLGVPVAKNGLFPPSP